MGILARLFGYEGKIRVQGSTVDGRSFTGSFHIETYGLDEVELKQKLKRIIYVEKGVHVADLRIVAYT